MEHKYLVDKVIELGVENGRLKERVEELESKEEELVRILMSMKVSKAMEEISNGR